MTISLPPPPAFHRLARLGRPVRWWRPLLVLGTALVLYAGLLIVPILSLVVLADLHPTVGPTLDQVLKIDTLNDPVGLAGLLILITLMLPATMLAVRLVGRRRAGTLLSVAGGLRWRLLGRAAVITAAVLAVFSGLMLLLDAPTESVPTAAIPAETMSTGEGDRLAAMLILVLLIVPWQAAAEEIVFRGLLAQTVGNWLRHPAWAILLPLPLFVLGHDYDAYGMASVAVFAAVAGYLTWRTGGLEAAIGMHVVNNVGAFVLALLTGADLDATAVDPLAALLSIAYTLLTAALILGLQPVAGPDRSQFAHGLGLAEREELFPFRLAPPQDDADQHGDLHDRRDPVADHFRDHVQRRSELDRPAGHVRQ